jgi:phosphatidylglycerophosphate synthase
MGLYMTLSLKGYIPFWLTTVVWARDLLILAIGGFIIVTGKKAALLIPQKLGKMSTALHMIFLGVTLLAPMEGTILYKPGTQNYAMIWFMYGMTIVTVLSGILYGRSALRLFRVHE